MNNINFDNIFEALQPYLISFGKAILILVIGLFVIKKILAALKSIMLKKDIDPSLVPFLLSLIGITLKAVLIISVIGVLGVETTSFAALIGAAGLAIGMALSGTLQNFAGGVMILIFKPFKVGDVIEAQGYTGGVSDIQIFNTILKTPDNKTIIIPNGGLSTNSMINYSTEATRRVDWTIGIGYGDSTEKAREVLNKLIANDERIMKDPAPFIAVSALADSSVNFTVRAWVKGADFWGVFFDMNENVYNTFNAEGLNIPYPQMDVHVHKNN